jgi:uncharacterized protein (TIGR02588 family)
MSEQSRSLPRTPAEWTTLGVVLLILAALIGPLIWYAIQPTDEAAFKVTVETSATAAREGRFYVPLRVLNSGDTTAEDVIVRATLLQDDQTSEEVEMTFTFLAGGEEAEAVAVFTKDPRRGTLEAGVTSYLIP